MQSFAYPVIMFNASHPAAQPDLQRAADGYEAHAARIDAWRWGSPASDRCPLQRYAETVNRAAADRHATGDRTRPQE